MILSSSSPCLIEMIYTYSTILFSAYQGQRIYAVICCRPSRLRRSLLLHPQLTVASHHRQRPQSLLTQLHCCFSPRRLAAPAHPWTSLRPPFSSCPFQPSIVAMLQLLAAHRHHWPLLLSVVSAQARRCSSPRSESLPPPLLAAPALARRPHLQLDF
jgi:hypothetical protein